MEETCVDFSSVTIHQIRGRRLSSNSNNAVEYLAVVNRDFEAYWTTLSALPSGVRNLLFDWNKRADAALGRLGKSPQYYFGSEDRDEEQVEEESGANGFNIALKKVLAELPESESESELVRVRDPAQSETLIR